MSHLICPFQAESYVASLLEQAQWEVIARNFRRRGCEIDLVARKGDTLTFVEVKLRRHFTGLGDFEKLLPRRKQMALKRGRALFLTTYRESFRQDRFDLALVKRSGEVDYFCGVL